MTAPLDFPSDWRFMHCPNPGQTVDWDGMQAYNWVRTLKGVPQSPIHHAEGDVWIHTKMVLDELCRLPAWAKLPEAERHLLFAATAMHDIAKPACTQVENDGSITSPRHAIVGRSMSRRLLYQGAHGCTPFESREIIVQLVRFHGLPLWFLEKTNPQMAVLQAAELVPMPLLAMLAEADVRGRICADQRELLDKVELFREYCQEQGVWDGPYAFPSAAARHTYFRNPASGPDYDPFENSKREVTMLCGLPGSGKDTWIKSNGQGKEVLSLDAIRIELGLKPGENPGGLIQTARERAKAFLRKDTPFIFNATNIIPDIRKIWLDLFEEYKARVQLVYIEVPYARMLKQNANRAAAVPQAAIEKMLQKWDVPGPWEAHTVDYFV